MASSTASPERFVVASALWTRSLVINAIALVLSRLLLNGFEIDGLSAYLIAIIGIELPTLVWWLTVRVLPTALDRWNAPSRAVEVAWAAAMVALVSVVPLTLATSVPGLLVAEWISPLRIDGFWTYAAASAITAALTIGLRQSRPLKYVRAFLAAKPNEALPQPGDSS